MFSCHPNPTLTLCFGKTDILEKMLEHVHLSTSRMLCKLLLKIYCFLLDSIGAVYLNPINHQHLLIHYHAGTAYLKISHSRLRELSLVNHPPFFSFISINVSFFFTLRFKFKPSLCCTFLIKVKSLILS